MAPARIRAGADRIAHNGFHVDEDHFAALDGVRPAFVEVLADDDEPATAVDDFVVDGVGE